MLAALVLLVAIGGGIATLTRGGGSASGGGATGRALAVASVKDFDPNSPDDVKAENPDRLGAITDGDPGTAWSTERYRDADLVKLKGGVGFLATLDASATLDQVAIDTPVGGWSARVYVSDAAQPPGDLAGWGDPVASVKDVAAGTVKVQLGGRTGKAVLIWFTKLANNGPQDNTAQVSGLAVRGS
ncbi:hypothetical protein [Aquihabitans sp. G128]|uniref:hypothetical protein n=1 Tax=Aquihabitans sp. G128 TaxID=2849779 RepID=UPI0020B455F3|nr:hypothetical protein [Aquihabitans sp. G128]